MQIKGPQIRLQGNQISIGDLVSALQCCCSKYDSSFDSYCVIYTDGDCDMSSDSSYLYMIDSTSTSGYDACEVLAYGVYPGLIACAVLFSVFFIALVFTLLALKNKGSSSSSTVTTTTSKPNTSTQTTSNPAYSPKQKKEKEEHDPEEVSQEMTGVITGGLNVSGSNAGVGDITDLSTNAAALAARAAGVDPKHVQNAKAAYNVVRLFL